MHFILHALTRFVEQAQLFMILKENLVPSSHEEFDSEEPPDFQMKKSIFLFSPEERS
jgi:hypothetical protein